MDRAPVDQVVNSGEDAHIACQVIGGGVGEDLRTKIFWSKDGVRVVPSGECQNFCFFYKLYKSMLVIVSRSSSVQICYFLSIAVCNTYLRSLTIRDILHRRQNSC